MFFVSAFSQPVFARSVCTSSNECVDENTCDYSLNGTRGDCIQSKPCPNGASDCSVATGDINNVFGILNPPPGADKYGNFCTGAMSFANNILRLFFIVSGLWAFLNIVIAGFQFMQAGGDPKKIEQAWAKIWQSFVGLLILVSSFLIAAIIGIVVFHDPGAILNPTITGAPGSVCQ